MPVPAQTSRIDVKRDFTNIIKRESFKDVLDIKNRVSIRRISKDGNQAGMELHIGRFHGKIPERSGTKLIARSFPLGPPLIPVGIENTGAEEILEKRYKPVPFGVILEIRLEHVLHVERISGHDAVHFARAAEYSGVGGAGGEDVGGPVEKAVAVLDESRDDMELASPVVLVGLVEF
nr:chitin synthase 1 [Ipomoea batatas]